MGLLSEVLFRGRKMCHSKVYERFWVLTIVADPEPDNFEKQDPDPDPLESRKLNPEPYPDPHQRVKP
jgi:hypothetical protein